MHRALTQYQILSLIFEYAQLCGRESYFPEERILFSFALTCTAFFAPAVALLWCDVKSLEPVLKVLGAVTKVNTQLVRSTIYLCDFWDLINICYFRNSFPRSPTKRGLELRDTSLAFDRSLSRAIVWSTCTNPYT